MNRTRIEPAFEHWASPQRVAGRSALIDLVNDNAQRLDTGRIDVVCGEANPIIATGHQAFIYHPGILAKDMVAQIAAGRFDATPLHLVVDQDVHEALGLQVPMENDGRLRVSKVRLGHEDQDVPTGFQPPAQLDGLSSQSGLPAELTRAFTDLPTPRTLAEQVTAALGRLRRPYAGNLPVLFCSDISHMESFGQLVRQMLDQPRACAGTYNQAVSAHPEAGVGSLAVELDRVELPLWACRWNKPRLRVFADLSDATPRLVDEHDQPIPLEPDPTDPDSHETPARVLPRALTMTALMRRVCCQRFIHGLGGWVYDQITEQWWGNWQNETLAPMALVTADRHLDFDVPQNTHLDLQRALWHAHHLPHNLDRELDWAQLDGQRDLVERKSDLLAHMADDRDRSRRRGAFDEIHHINAQLAQAHPEPLTRARQDLDRARLGVTNQRILAKRDWPFPLYPPQALHALRAEIDAQGPHAHANHDQ